MSRRSLLLVSLVAIAAGTFVWATYRKAEARLNRAAGGQTEAAAANVAGMIQQSAERAAGDMKRAASNPVIVNALKAPTDENREAARAYLLSFGLNGPRRIELWAEDGSEVLDISLSSTARAGEVPQHLPRGSRPTGPGVSKLELQNGLVCFRAVEEIPMRRGFLSMQTALFVTQPRKLEQLLGSDGDLRVGNADGSLWTDLKNRTAGPAIDTSKYGVIEYQGREGRPRVGALVGIRDTPWVAWVDFVRPTIADLMPFSKSIKF